jgi:hypothetical protein
MRSTTKLAVVASLFLGVQAVAGQNRPLAKTVDDEHHSVVALLRVDSAGSVSVAGSGVLIHPMVVLTAGHVNHDDVRKARGGARVEGVVSVGGNAFDPEAQFEFDWMEDVVSHPETNALLQSLADTTDLRARWGFSDVGLVFLRSPVRGRTPARLPAANVLAHRGVEDVLVGVGFGYHMMPDSTFSDELVDGLRRQWSFHSATLVNDLWLLVDCDSVQHLPYIGPHDSGAPLFMGGDVVGVWSRWAIAEEPCWAASAAVRVDNPGTLQWIRARVQERIGVDLHGADAPPA